MGKYKFESSEDALSAHAEILQNGWIGASEPKDEYLLHARRVRGGKLVVFNISEKYRGEKISEGRKKIKASKASADAARNENDKK